MRISSIIFTVMLIALSEPAIASTHLPEPSDFAIFLLGVAGLIIGRRIAVSRRQPKDDGAA